jgi:hypothetical protein
MEWKKRERLEAKMKLFELPEETAIPVDTVSATGRTCIECEHRQRWQCNSKVFQYCGKRKSNRTSNGLLKIKCKDNACALFEPCC